MLHFLKLMLQLVLSPSRGWEDIAAGADNARRTLLVGLMPLAALAAVTVFLGAFYQLHPSFAKLFIQAVIAFAKYVGTYFVGVAALGYALPKLTLDGRADRERVEVFCSFCVGLMALVGIIENFLPMEVSLLQFLPLYVIVVMCMGRAYLDVDERNIFRFAAVGTLSIILPVYLIDRIMLSAA